MDAQCKFITEYNTAFLSPLCLNGNRKRSMKSIVALNLQSMDLKTLEYMVDNLTIVEEFFIRPNTFPYDEYAAADVICRANENPNAVFSKLEDYCKNNKWSRVGLKCGKFKFYYPQKPPKTMMNNLIKINKKKIHQVYLI